MDTPLKKKEKQMNNKIFVLCALASVGIAGLIKLTINKVNKSKKRVDVHHHYHKHY